jgi:predicted flap endonuclease-1-like 5' DNA nuclease
MTILLVQTFLLMLGAFLLGASLACLMRRGVAHGEEVAVAAASSAGAAALAMPRAADTDRFGRALAGGEGPAVPPVFAGQPIVEVQPRPAPSQPVQRAAPAPQPAPPPAPAPQPAASPPPPVEAPKPSASDGPSYTQVAVAAAAAATAAAAAKAKQQQQEAEAEAARLAAEQKAEAEAARAREAAAEAQHAAAAAKAAQIAEAERAAAAAAAAAVAPAAVETEAEPDDAEPSRFGSPIEETGYAPVPGSREPADDLTRIHGIDAELKERLTRYGIHQFATIAAWTPDDVRGVSQSLGFQGRVERENWIEQAQILASGGDVSRARRPAAPIDVAVPVNGDRLHRVIGIDPESEALLYANGVSGLADIAAWTVIDVERIETLLSAPGRVARESWIEQARFLTRGADAGDASEDETTEAAPMVDAPLVPIFGRPVVADSVAAEPVAAESVAVESVAPTRSESYAGLRSVRSEALRGEGAAFSGYAAGAIDDLKRIRGIGVLIERKLNSLGITAYEQVANWTGADIDRISQVLDFKGRIERENWIEQARILASGGQTEFSRRADRGEV